MRKAEIAARKSGLAGWQVNSFYCAGKVFPPAVTDAITCQVSVNTPNPTTLSLQPYPYNPNPNPNPDPDPDPDPNPNPHPSLRRFSTGR